MEETTTNPTAADLRLALARVTLLSVFSPSVSDEELAEHTKIVDAEIERILPMFEGILSREDIYGRLCMSLERASIEGLKAAIIVARAAAGGAA